MYIPFDNLPETSRIWIYQSNRKFSDAELTEIENDLKNVDKLCLLYEHKFCLLKTCRYTISP